MWASVALSQDYVNYAKLLLASEQLAAGVYWHLDPQAGRDDRDNPYPEPEMRKLVSMGNVMDYQSGAWLFWGSQKVEIAAIQILPLTPTNEVRLGIRAVFLPKVVPMLMKATRSFTTPNGSKMCGTTPCPSLSTRLSAMNGNPSTPSSQPQQATDTSSGNASSLPRMPTKIPRPPQNGAPN